MMIEIRDAFRSCQILSFRQWFHNDDHPLAPLGRSFSGSIKVYTEWPHEVIMKWL